MIGSSTQVDGAKRQICFVLLEPFHACLPAKFRKSANMGKQIFSAATINMDNKKRLSFILISNPLKQPQKVINAKIMGKWRFFTFIIVCRSCQSIILLVNFFSMFSTDSKSASNSEFYSDFEYVETVAKCYQR